MGGRATADAGIDVIEKDGVCGICPAGCWVTVTMEDGRIRAVRPQDHPLGMICTNGAHSAEIVHDPDRLRHPLRRVGPKGTYEFERIGWDEAFEIIVENLETMKAQHGPESTAIYTGRGSFELALCDVFQPADVAISSASSVLFPFGSPNTLGVGALCYVSFAMIAPHVTFGEYYHTTEHDIENAELIVIWGANPATDSPPLAHEQIKQAVLRGADVICIDPQRNYTAREVDATWVPIRPGTDGALALGMINVLIEEELYDDDFAENWTVGFEELSQYVQHFRPETVEEITGVPAATVAELARRIARARGAAPVMYTGLEYSDSGVQAIRAVFTLWALAGQLDVPGGLNIRMRENQFPINRDGLVPNPNPKKALGRDRFPVYSMYRGESHAIALPDSVVAGEPYKIRSLIILGGSIVTAWPQPEIWRKTLEGLEFVVSINRHHTADSAYADIVLPATTYYEITSYMTYGPVFKIREKMVEPVGESRNDYLILTELAERLGYGDRYPRTEEDLLRHVLDGSGFTPQQVREAGGSVQIPTVMMEYKKWEKGKLREDGQPGFNTPSGKFEIKSSVLEEHGYDGLPVYTEPGEGPLAQPALAKEYPLVFNSGARIFADFRSQHHGVPGLNRKAPVPQVTLNSKDATARGIEDGDWVWVVTPRGKVKYSARVTDHIVEGAIDANMGGGGPLGPKEWQDCNVNDLTDLQRYDPISGFPVYKALLCDVVKAEGGNGACRTGEAESEAVVEVKKHEGPRRHVYFDHNATTPLDPEVLEAMLPFLESEFGNPSSIHSRGGEAKDAVEAARRKVAQALGCTARRVVFTGGGSEGDNLAIKGVALARRETGAHIVTSVVEHPAVLRTCEALQELGFEVTYLEVDATGRVDPDSLVEAIRPDTVLVSVMLANSEVGTINPIRELAEIAHEHDVLFHTDAVQGLGKLPIDVEELGVDLLSVSSHKIHGPKGVGALYVRKGVELSPVIHGGGQEHKLRAGTENVPGIVGFGKACELAVRRLNGREMDRVRGLRDRLEAGIREIVSEARLNGHADERLPNTLNLTLPGMRGESLVLFLDRYGVYFSSGSACKSGNPDPSHVLKALGLSDEDAHCAIRMSLGVGNEEADINYVLESLREIVGDRQSSVRFVGCR
ncbi:MAG: aminotransferase class V-fold PLP-dependent enzyme [Gemmatimonadetes bacterium]|uniref:cysteine desulfurase n=1 Tax=Candidatus Kutchimonas denitrificans TaxID=3056748 RepID=A0AAE4ZB32_9BACT|nr:aminotransferase class V-fold PLP-dependent enzyme [Gemmatimonadota bacterium]NIR74861.1 aminotransferase class V-fold PLP-dependent enzyme [Candidatus Kutchimonas denitrificans]NIR99972.1 aminotransferase class V-fold PLP-dependent enzyme [Gemmatimonadota bacterium]NIT65556.1 aminotransferase class V-fold PLP-dependent enzyme [Gemmatimonadota bacterium]NIU52526.1 aminotransferase class V-fold PLP-dependent enzyme [Gemmatimonadota bacterium]